MRMLLTASMILAFSAVPAAAQQQSIYVGGALGVPVKQDRIKDFARCVVRTDALGAAAYVRAKSGSAHARAAMARLEPAYTACDSNLGRRMKPVREARKREAIGVALYRYRSQVARLN
jgi:hypothetical protein